MCSGLLVARRVHPALLHKRCPCAVLLNAEIAVLASQAGSSSVFDHGCCSKTPAGPLPTSQPPPLYGWLDTLFGWLTKPYTRTSPGPGGTTSWTFPICIGETGTAFIKYPLPTPVRSP